eukprot:503838_1
MAISKSNIFLIILFLHTASCLHTYISKYGSDQPQCGEISNPCGTLDYATYRQFEEDHLYFHVIDGQNETDIKYWININSGYHPCLPWIETHIAFFWKIHIEFNSTNIQTMNDWYPPICHNASFTENRFMIEIYPSDYGFLDLTISNLIIDNFSFYTTHWDYVYPNELKGIYKSYRPVTVGTIFHSITLQNIEINIYYMYDGMIDSLIRTRQITIENSKISNITTNLYDYYINYANKYSLITEGIQTLFKMNNTQVYTANINHIFVSTTDDFVSASVIDSKFDGINCQIALFYVKTTQYEFINVEFNDIHSGAIFIYEEGTLQPKASNVIFNNVTISTDQFIGYIDAYQKPVVLFDFGSDPQYYVSMTNMKIYYNLDLYQQCYFEIGKEINDTIDIICKSPITFFNNIGYIEIRNIFLSINVTKSSMQSYREHIASELNINIARIMNNEIILVMYYQMRLGIPSLVYYAFIYNHNELLIQNMFVNRGVYFHRTFIQNTNVLYIDNIRNVNMENEWNLTINQSSWHYANVIQCELFVHQYSANLGNFNTTIANSDISGAYFSFYSGSGHGILSVYNSSFHDTVSALVTTISANVQSSLFYRIGAYYSSNYYWYAYLVLPRCCLWMPMSFWVATINKCEFTFYNPLGFLQFKTYNSMTNATIWNSVFTLNTDNILYTMVGDVFRTDSSATNFTGLISIINNHIFNSFSIVSNRFSGNHLDYSVPWLYIDTTNLILNETTTKCLYGNTFENYALYLQSGIVTSCYRMDMISCLLANTCIDSLNYGKLNSDLYENNHGVFVWNMLNSNSTQLKEKIYSVVIASENAYLGMDNIQFIDFLHIVSLDFINISTGHLFVIDGVFVDDNRTKMDSMLYSTDNCIILTNYRANLSVFGISKLIIDCDVRNRTNSTNTKFQYSIYSNVTKYVQYYAPQFIEFYLEKHGNYFPGDILRIDSFDIFDSYNNSINFTMFSAEISAELNAVSNDFDFYQELTISSTGECSVCDTGLYIPTIALDNENIAFNTTYEITVTIVTEVLNPINFYIKIIYCPPGYGSWDGKLCQQCLANFFYFGHQPNEPCKSCSDINGIQCLGGTNLTVLQNHWFHTQRDIISVGTCVYGYCCTNNTGCSYNEINNNICAKNRNVSTKLCSDCLNGYSMAFGSRECVKCDDNHLEYLFYPFTIALIYVIYLMVITSESTSKNNLSSNSRLNKFAALLSM